ncbi:diacylglycerol kinase [Pseudoxanthomonas sp. X-1]|uniref:diacylglycerol kinase n=1 Tax=Pseudoxanthomonas sp. X-1 TaxID=2571115 RepID=UPI00110C1140|nr:diacylglycerol kinase [Pseudoxanthomonas sp. X-1]TMN19396.1 diacylglycerol kinase [Pseudoxanthomonas sp. X-1]UAY75341.1 diacylglycerol kinase [Pseudoxanthomonas sp. X-1]
MADKYGHSPRDPRRLWLAFTWSMKGLRAAWLYESSFRLEVCLAVLLLPLGVTLGESGPERALLVTSVLLVLTMELLNSAIEAVIERYGPEHHELAGRAKDMGSAAVFVAMIGTAATWLLVLAG